MPLSNKSEQKRSPGPESTAWAATCSPSALGGVRGSYQWMLRACAGKVLCEESPNMQRSLAAAPLWCGCPGASQPLGCVVSAAPGSALQHHLPATPDPGRREGGGKQLWGHCFDLQPGFSMPPLHRLPLQPPGETAAHSEPLAKGRLMDFLLQRKECKMVSHPVCVLAE